MKCCKDLLFRMRVEELKARVWSFVLERSGSRSQVAWHKTGPWQSEFALKVDLKLGRITSVGGLSLEPHNSNTPAEPLAVDR